MYQAFSPVIVILPVCLSAWGRRQCRIQHAAPRTVERVRPFQITTILRTSYAKTRRQFNIYLN